MFGFPLTLPFFCFALGDCRKTASTRPIRPANLNAEINVLIPPVQLAPGNGPLVGASPRLKHVRIQFRGKNGAPRWQIGRYGWKGK